MTRTLPAHHANACAAWFGSLALLLLAACSPDDSGDKTADGSGDLAEDSLGDASDATEGSGDGASSDVADDTVETSGATMVQVAYDLKFARINSDGTTIGLNLDDRVSGGNDDETCGKGDFESPEGLTGVDSQFATIMPALELTELGAIEELVKTAIDEGELLLMFELEGVDDPMNDDSVDFTFLQGVGVPIVGTDGFIEPSQTFDRDLESPSQALPDLAITDGRMIAGPFVLQIPLTIFGNNINLIVYHATFVSDMDDQGGSTGFVAGAVKTSDIRALVEGLSNVDTNLIFSFVEGIADMAWDGTACTEISVVLEFRTMPAFFFEDSPPVPTSGEGGADAAD